ncbi:MAG: hypothetical protein WC472_01700 [Candidatus Paceibacterota bacterium]
MNNFITFKISKQNEIFVFFEFLNQGAAENTTSLYDFIKLKDKNTSSKDEIIRFVDNVYEKELINIESTTKEIQEKWENKQDFFFKESAKIFKNKVIIKNEIVATPSIWPIYGRFFERRLITFPYKNGADEAIFVITHEYLHFLFYNYINSQYEILYHQNLNQKIWDFSEVINVIIQNQPQWVDIFSIKTSPYPKHQELYKRMLEEWNRNSDIDYLINKFILLLKSFPCM